MAKTAVVEKPFIATGRRKTAIASVRLFNGDGKIVVNGSEFAEYFPTDTLRNTVLAPLETVQGAKKFNIFARVRGGGPMGQAGAMRHAVSRALLKVDPTWRSSLKVLGFLTRDPRMRERKKYGQPGARKRFQFSKR